MDTTEQPQFDEIIDVQIGADGTGSTVLNGVDAAAITNLTILRLQQGSIALGSWHGLPAVVVAGAMPGVGVQVGYDLQPEAPQEPAPESIEPPIAAASTEPSLEPPAADTAPEPEPEPEPEATAQELEAPAPEPEAPSDVEAAVDAPPAPDTSAAEPEAPAAEPEPEPEPAGDQGSPQLFVLCTARSDRSESHAYGPGDQAELEQAGARLAATDPAVHSVVMPLEAVPA